MVGDESAWEAERLYALSRYEILDTVPEREFDDIARLAARVCHTSSSLVTLIDEHRQWFKARFNFAATETPRAIALCDYTIRGREVLVVEDALADPRFADNPLVTGDPRIRFYAGAPLLSPNGNAIGSLAVVDYQPRTLSQEQRDVLAALAQQVMALVELRWHRRNLERFALFARATDDVVYDWNIQTNAIWFSDALARIYGAHDASFEAWLARIHPDDAMRVDRSLRDVLDSGGSTWRGEYRYRRADETYASVVDRGYIVRDPAGRPLRMVGAMADLSERVRLEEQVIRAQRMQAIGQLAGGVAHDFNNILTVIECNAYLLKRADEDRDEYIDEIFLAVERAASLTRQLLMVSRKQPMRRINVRLQEVVTGMTQMLRRLIGEHIELVVRTDATPTISGDAAMLEQVVLNLAVNARDAMPNGGRLVVETHDERVADARTLYGNVELAPGTYAVLRVEDTGTGIAPDVLPRIFEAFFTTKEAGKGTGLGLSTLFGIVRQHRGAIDVQSVPDEGTTFVIYFPAAA